MVTSKKEKDSIYNFIRPADDNLIGLNRMIIEMKKNETKEKQEKKFSKEGLSPKRTEIDLKEFVKHIKPFEWYGSQRDLSPELKRIVKNLAC